MSQAEHHPSSKTETHSTHVPLTHKGGQAKTSTTRLPPEVLDHKPADSSKAGSEDKSSV